MDRALAHLRNAAHRGRRKVKVYEVFVAGAKEGSTSPR